MVLFVMMQSVGFLFSYNCNRNDKLPKNWSPLFISNPNYYENKTVDFNLCSSTFRIFQL